MVKRFKQLSKAGLCLLVCLLALAGCVEKDIYNPDNNGNTPSKDDFFDFSTTSTYTLDVNYGLKNYPVLFELYAENPLTIVDGIYTKADNVRPFYRAATNNSGKFSGEISLPSYVETVYLYCPYIGVVKNVELSIEGTQITFDQLSYINEMITRSGSTTRATTDNGYTYPDGYLVLGDWNSKGRPEYLMNGNGISSDFSSRLTKTVVKNQARDEAFASSHASPDIVITKATTLSIVMISSNASKGQVVGYFTYPTGTSPATPADIKNPVIAFPTVEASHTTVNYGDEVALKYWNENTNQFEDEFPAGVSVSFFYMHDAFDDKGNIVIQQGAEVDGQTLSSEVDYIFYSNPSLNQKLGNGKDAQRTITMYDGDNLAAICFETDIKSTPFKQGSWDYTDVIMAIRFTDAGAVEPNQPDLPQEPEVPTNNDNYVGYWGTLAFEDLWPSQGDYDMNDVAVYYESTIYKDVTSNNVIKIVDKFYTAHKPEGASLINGFGYQFHKIASSAVSNVSITTDSNISSPGLEAGQDHPTIILFENGKDAAKEMASFTVTTTFNGGVNESDVRPPYNPFIIARMNQTRGTEVHLTNYRPTKLADTSLLGTSDDKSDSSIGLYYVSGGNFPFAIHLDHAYLELSPERMSIDKTYPGFTNWVESKGASNKNWYVK